MDRTTNGLDIVTSASGWEQWPRCTHCKTDAVLGKDNHWRCPNRCPDGR